MFATFSMDTAQEVQNIDLDWASAEETMTLPTIPHEWRYIALSKLGELGRGKSKHRPRNDPALFEDGKYPFIQTGDVKAAKQYITTCAKKYGNFGLQQSKLWPKGTLCITIAANIAETAFLGIDACFPDSIVGFTPSEYIIPEYIKHFIESQKVRLWAFAPATAQKNINLDTLENLVYDEEKPKWEMTYLTTNTGQVIGTESYYGRTVQMYYDVLKSPTAGFSISGTATLSNSEDEDIV